MCSFVESLESKQKYPVLINWKLSSLSYFSNSGSTYASLITVSEFGFTLILPSSLYTPFSSSTIFSYRRISAFFAVGTDTQWIVPRTFLHPDCFLLWILDHMSHIHRLHCRPHLHHIHVHVTKYAFIRRTSLPTYKRRYFLGFSILKSSRSIYNSLENGTCLVPHLFVFLIIWERQRVPLLLLDSL